MPMQRLCRGVRTAGGAALKAAYDAAAAAGLVTGPKVVFDESLPAGSLPKLKELRKMHKKGASLDLEPRAEARAQA